MTPIQQCTVLGYCLPGDACWGGSNGLPGAEHLPQDIGVAGGASPSMSPL